MEDLKLDNEMRCHWRMVYEENYQGVDDKNKKALIHAMRWYVYVNEKEKLIKGGYLVVFVGYDRRKVIWEVVDNHVIEEENDNDEIGLQGFNFNFFDKD